MNKTTITIAPPITETSERCHWCAAVMACASTLVMGLVYRGWSVSSSQMDWFPSLLCVATCTLMVGVGGRLSPRWHALYTAISVLLSIVLGKILAWDLFGVIAANTLEGALNETLLSKLHLGLRLEYQSFGIQNAIAAFLSITLSVVLPFLAKYFERPSQIGETIRSHLRKSDISLHPHVATRLSLVDTVWFVVICATVGGLWILLRPMGSEGFRLITFPADTHSSRNTVLGYSQLLQGKPVMSETISSMTQVAWFSGNIQSDNSFRFLRAGYSFLAAHAQPFVGTQTALLLVNALSWVACVIFTSLLTLRASGSHLNARLAALIAATGVGFAVHVDSTTPHTLSFALYIGGVWMLEQIGVVSKPLTLRTHVAIAMVLGMMSCCYNVAQMLLLIYVIQGLAVQRWRHLILVVLISTLFRPWWRLAIAALGINVQDTERDYLQSAMESWYRWWQEGWWTVTKNLTLILIEIASSLESPFYLILAAAAWIAVPIRRESRRWILISILVPFCACLVFSPVASARGYIVYGGAWGVFTLIACGLGVIIAKGQSNRLATVFAIFLVAACVSLQAIWCTSHWRTELGPIKCFFLGIFDSQTANFFQPLPIVDLTDNAPSALGQILFEPVSYSPIEEGQWKPMERQSILLCLLTRLPFTLGCVAIGCSFCRYKRSLRILIGTGVGIWIAGSACSYWTLSSVPEPFDFNRHFSMRAGESTDYRLIVSDASLQVLQKASQSAETRFSVFIPADGRISVDFVNLGELSPSREFPQEWNCKDSPIRDGIRTWTIRIKNESDGQVHLAGWMRPTDLRYMATASTQSSVPAIEIRLRNREGRLLCLAF